MGINLTPKGWAAASPGPTPCGHRCMICEPQALSPEYRQWALLVFRIGDVERSIEAMTHPVAKQRMTAYRDQLVARRDALWEELR